MLLKPSDYIRMPWKNGGGTTTEIARHPADGDFGWRVSIADVETSGPFSRFETYDRHILMLEGGGMELNCGPHGNLSLAEPFTPQSFPGEWEVHGQLLNGPVRDFNLMTKRGQYTGTLEAVTLRTARTLACPPNGWILAYIAKGNLADAAESETLLTRSDLPAAPQGEARLVVARIA